MIFILKMGIQNYILPLSLRTLAVDYYIQVLALYDTYDMFLSPNGSVDDCNALSVACGVWKDKCYIVISL